MISLASAHGISIHMFDFFCFVLLSSWSDARTTHLCANGIVLLLDFLFTINISLNWNFLPIQNINSRCTKITSYLFRRKINACSWRKLRTKSDTMFFSECHFLYHLNQIVVVQSDIVLWKHSKTAGKWLSMDE